MNISVTAPLEKAFERTKQVLFEDFSPGKWFALGFCAWLANLGEGMGGSAGNSTSSNRSFGDGVHWIENNWDTIIAVGFGVALVSVLAILVLSWLRARGVFMFLDGIVHNRAEIKRPWSQFGTRGNRLFLANAILGIAGLVFIVTPIIVGLMIAWGDIQHQRFEGAALIGTLVGAIGVIIPSIVFALLSWLLRNFVTPTMYLHDVSVMEAWRRVKSEVITMNLGAIGLFLLMRMGVAFVIGSISVAAVCFTCCLVAIPYIGTVILLPLFVFERSYGLYFLEQFGSDWRFFPTAEVVVEAVEPEQ